MWEKVIWVKDKNDSNFLYFDDKEIEKEKTENKQIFVTKRLAGKETHNIKKQIKAEEITNKDNKKIKDNYLVENELIIDIPISTKNVKTPKRLMSKLNY